MFHLKLLSIKIEKKVNNNKFYLLYQYIQITVLESNIGIAFSRSVDGNADDWAKGFTGSMYQAEITTNEPFTAGWNFKVRLYKNFINFFIFIHNLFLGLEFEQSIIKILYYLFQTV